MIKDKDESRPDRWFFGISIFFLALALAANAWVKHEQNVLVYPTQEDLREREIGSVEMENQRLAKAFEALRSRVEELSHMNGETQGRLDVMHQYFAKYSPEKFEEIVRKIQLDVERMDNKTHIPTILEECEKTLFLKFATRSQVDGAWSRIQSIQSEVDALEKAIGQKPSTVNEVNPFRDMGDVP